MKKKIVISAVNLNKGGTLTILRDCLSFLSEFSSNNDYEVVAIVYDKALAFFPNIEYIETKWPKARWTNRIWYEYISMNKISKDIGPVYLWFSLHDTTPTVKAERRAVYCHNSFSFYKWKFRELIYDPKIVLFALFTKYIYRVNIHKNNYVVVQQEWFRQAFVRMFGLRYERIIVAPPEKKVDNVIASSDLVFDKDTFSFLYPAYSNSNKNFEVIFSAVELLENKGINNFKVYLTINGQENTYTNWLFKKYSHLKCIQWLGFLKRNDLYFYYENCDSLIFASKIESWGLPISEFLPHDKPMILADLPYAHEAAATAQQVAFFDPDNTSQLANLVNSLINGELNDFGSVATLNLKEPVANNWKELFDLLLTN